MENLNKDILTVRENLRQRPFTTPEGYFEAFRDQAKIRVREPQVTLWGRLTPYASLAAVFLSIFAVGSLLFNNNDHEITQEEYIYFSDGLITTYNIESSDQYAEAGIQDEDIIEYLIYSGVTAEEIELSK